MYTGLLVLNNKFYFVAQALCPSVCRESRYTVCLCTWLYTRLGLCEVCFQSHVYPVAPLFEVHPLCVPSAILEPAAAVRIAQ